MKLGNKLKITLFIFMLLNSVKDGLAQEGEIHGEIYTKVVLTYVDDSLKGHPKTFYNKITVHFEDGFEENVEVYYGNKILLKERLISEGSSGSTLKEVECYRKGKKDKIFTVKLLRSGLSLDIILDYRYKHLCIYQLYDDEWILNYQNTAPGPYE
jgi:hypothetical protein